MDHHERTILIESGVRRGGGLFPADDACPCLDRVTRKPSEEQTRAHGHHRPR